MGFEVKRIVDTDDPVLVTVTKWICDWWGPEQDPEQMYDYYKRSVFEERLPQTYVGFADGVPVGTFQFGMGDIFVRPDVYPWLKHVCVAPEYRGKGYAAMMMRYAADEIRKMDFTCFYLFTHLTGFYEKFGWEYIETFQGFADYGMQRLYVFKK